MSLWQPISSLPSKGLGEQTHSVPLELCWSADLLARLQLYVAIASTFLFGWNIGS